MKYEAYVLRFEVDPDPVTGIYKHVYVPIIRKVYFFGLFTGRRQTIVRNSLFDDTPVNMRYASKATAREAYEVLSEYIIFATYKKTEGERIV